MSIFIYIWIAIGTTIWLWENLHAAFIKGDDVPLYELIALPILIIIGPVSLLIISIDYLKKQNFVLLKGRKLC